MFGRGGGGQQTGGLAGGKNCCRGRGWGEALFVCGNNGKLAEGNSKDKGAVVKWCKSKGGKCRVGCGRA